MMGLDEIERLSDECAEDAARDNREPYVPFDAAEVRDRWGVRCPIPNLGSYVPDNWEIVRDDDDRPQEWFVDKSGWGQSGEAALTIDEFVRRVADYVEEHPGEGFAVSEEGAFQIYITAYRRKEE